MTILWCSRPPLKAYFHNGNIMELQVTPEGLHKEYHGVPRLPLEAYFRNIIKLQAAAEGIVRHNHGVSGCPWRHILAISWSPRSPLKAYFDNIMEFQVVPLEHLLAIWSSGSPLKAYFRNIMQFQVAPRGILWQYHVVPGFP